jgi:ATP-dependent protease HslVU (ClpYQ) peptidase subunit
MTTIVYSKEENVIVCDGRCLKGHSIMSDKSVKVYHKDGVTFVGAGSIADIRMLVETYPYGFEGMTDLEACVFATYEGRVFECCIIEGDYNIVELDCSSTLGSGGQFALAALDFGFTAKQAIKYAMTRDCATGGKIQTVKVGKKV